VTQQMREELDDLPAANGSGKQSEVEVPPRHARDRRIEPKFRCRRLELFCVAADLRDRRASQGD
jgi:hypothetical protein